METVSSSETSVYFYQITQRNISEDSPCIVTAAETSNLMYVTAVYLTNTGLWSESLREPGQVSRYSDGLLAGQPGFYSCQGQEIFPYSTASRPALGPNQSLLSDGYRGLFFHGLNRPGREADHSPPSSAEVKNVGAVPPHLHTTTSLSA
jgi:hypothetical protein